ncbi:hypothetical protein VQ643_12510 [Pseudomonas sp. F1_0610]|uniref:hypothetical protein n=1 Tax=Pseudomonas sp. F1_0610 TaxID=3114284 RepID=UPI0039C3AE2A
MEASEVQLSRVELLQHTARRNSIYGLSNLLLLVPLLLWSQLAYLSTTQKQPMSWQMLGQVLGNSLFLSFVGLLVLNLLLDVLVSKRPRYVGLRKCAFILNIAFMLFLIVKGLYLIIPVLLYKLLSYLRYLSFFNAKDLKL